MAVVISARLLEGSDRLLDAEPDAQLVRLAQAGHAAAFAAIVRRYQPELKAQAHQLTSEGRAEDALQQAFLNAFAALQAGHEVRHLRGWLHHILRNEVIRARVPLEAPLEAAALYGEPLEDTVQLRAAAHAALTELSALPERQRDALLSTAVLGLPRAHVAHAMGLSEGAVRQLVHRARAHVRRAANALLPFPLVKLFSAAPSAMDAAPDVALGAGAASGAAASGGLAIKVGALLASGVVATGVAVTHISPVHRHSAAPSHGSQHHLARAPATRVSPASATGAAASVTRNALREHGSAGSAGSEGRSQGGPGRLAATRSGRHGGRGSGRGHGQDGGGGQEGSGRPRGDTSGREHDGSAAARDGGHGSQGSGGGGSAGSEISGGGGSDGGSGGGSDGGSGGGSDGGSGGGSGGGGDESSGGSRDLSGSADSSSS
jgi:RNA polymerase sigma factor (sigma-70 family)